MQAQKREIFFGVCRMMAYTVDMRKKHTHPFKISVNELARILGVTRGHLSDVLNHHTTPSLTLALAIQRETRGKVKAADLVAEKDRV